MLLYGALASQAGKFEDSQKNASSSWLPADAEPVKALEAVQQFPGGELAPAVIDIDRRVGWPSKLARPVGVDQRLRAERPSEDSKKVSTSS